MKIRAGRTSKRLPRGALYSGAVVALALLVVLSLLFARPPNAQVTYRAVLAVTPESATIIQELLADDAALQWAFEETDESGSPISAARVQIRERSPAAPSVPMQLELEWIPKLEAGATAARPDPEAVFEAGLLRLVRELNLETQGAAYPHAPALRELPGLLAASERDERALNALLEGTRRSSELLTRIADSCERLQEFDAAGPALVSADPPPPPTTAARSLEAELSEPESENPVWLERKAEIARLEIEYESLLKSRTERHPAVRNLKLNLEQARRQLASLSRDSQPPPPPAETRVTRSATEGRARPKRPPESGFRLADDSFAQLRAVSRRLEQFDAQSSEAVERIRQRTEVLEQLATATQSREVRPTVEVLRRPHAVNAPRPVPLGRFSLALGFALVAGVGVTFHVRGRSRAVVTSAESLQQNLTVRVVACSARPEADETKMEKWLHRGISLLVASSEMALCVAIASILGMLITAHPAYQDLARNPLSFIPYFLDAIRGGLL